MQEERVSVPQAQLADEAMDYEAVLDRYIAELTAYSKELDSLYANHICESAVGNQGQRTKSAALFTRKLAEFAKVIPEFNKLFERHVEHANIKEELKIRYHEVSLILHAMYTYYSRVFLEFGVKGEFVPNIMQELDQTRFIMIAELQGLTKKRHQFNLPKTKDFVIDYLVRALWRELLEYGIKENKQSRNCIKLLLMLRMMLQEEDQKKFNCEISFIIRIFEKGEKDDKEVYDELKQSFICDDQVADSHVHACLYKFINVDGSEGLGIRKLHQSLIARRDCSQYIINEVNTILLYGALELKNKNLMNFVMKLWVQANFPDSKKPTVVVSQLDQEQYKERIESYMCFITSKIEELDVLLLKLSFWPYYGDESSKLKETDVKELFIAGAKELSREFNSFNEMYKILLGVISRHPRRKIYKIENSVHANILFNAAHCYYTYCIWLRGGGKNAAMLEESLKSFKTLAKEIGSILPLDSAMKYFKVTKNNKLVIDLIMRCIYANLNLNKENSDACKVLVNLLNKVQRIFIRKSDRDKYSIEKFLLFHALKIDQKRLSQIKKGSLHYAVYCTSLNSEAKNSIKLLDLVGYFKRADQNYSFFTNIILFGLMAEAVRSEENVKELMKVLLNFIFSREVVLQGFGERLLLDNESKSTSMPSIESVMKSMQGSRQSKPSVKKGRKKKKKKAKGGRKRQDQAGKKPSSDGKLKAPVKVQVGSNKSLEVSKKMPDIMHPDLRFPGKYAQGISHYKKLEEQEADIKRQCLCLCYAYICGQRSKIKEADRRALLFQILNLESRVDGSGFKSVLKEVKKDLKPGGFYAPKTQVLDIPVEDAGIQKIIDALKSEFDVFDHGGSIRNTLLGIPVNDIDVIVDATLDDLQAFVMPLQADLGIHAIKVVGSDVKILLLTLENKEKFEITALRNAENKDWPLHIVLRDNILKRDFTINALFRDRRTGEVLDYGAGLNDLERKRFVTVKDNAGEAFQNHFIHLLRLFYYRAQFLHHQMQFGCSKSINAAIRQRKYRSNLDARVKMHVYYKFYEMLHVQFAEIVLDLLKETKVLYFILPCLNESNVNLFITTVQNSRELTEVEFWSVLVSKITGDLEKFLKDAAFTMKPSLSHQVNQEVVPPCFDSPISSSAASGWSSPSSEPTSPSSSHSSSTMSTSPD